MKTTKKYVTEDVEMWEKINKVLLQKGHEEAINALKKEAETAKDKRTVLYVANKLMNAI